MAAKKTKVQINYKSGTVMVVECDHWKLTQNAGGLTSFILEGVEPYAPFLGIGEIESIWELS